MESRYYPGVEADTIKLMTELRDLFDEDFEVQSMQVSSTAVLQARKSSTLRDITGLSAALTIKVTPETGGTRVEMGMQKWFDKAAVAAVALALSAGLLLATPRQWPLWATVVVGLIPFVPLFVVGARWNFRLRPH